MNVIMTRKRLERVLKEITGQSNGNIDNFVVQPECRILSDSKIITDKFNDYFLKVVDDIIERKYKPHNFLDIDIKNNFTVHY